MPAQEEQTITQWAQRETTAKTIDLVEGLSSAATQMIAFCDRLKHLAPAVTIKKADDTEVEGPAMIVGSHRNIVFRAVPAGKTLPPFLDLLRDSESQQPELASDVRQALDRVSLPVFLKLYIAPQCPHCPKVVGQLLPLAAATPLMNLTIIDAALFEKLAQTDKVQAVPTLLLDDQFRWTGQIDPQEIIRLSIERDPASMSPASLRQILEAGQADRAAHMMIEAGKFFPALLALLTHARWSVRLGAMVSVEYLADEAPKLANQLIDPLRSRFDDLSGQVQGDVVHTVGQIQTQSAKAFLHRIVSGGYEDEVIQTAMEALAEID